MPKKVIKMVKLQVPAGKGNSGTSCRPGTWSGWYQHHGLRQGL